MPADLAVPAVAPAAAAAAETPAEPGTPVDETEALEAGLDVLDTPSGPGRPRARALLGRVAPPLVAAVVLLLAWQVIVSSGLKPSYALPSPAAVWASLIEQLQSNAAQRAAFGSLRRAAVGFTISIILGTLLGIVLSRFRLIRRGIGPLVTGMQSLPSVAWVPAAILWFGLTDAAVYAVVLLGSVPSIANGLLAGIDHAPPSYRRVARVLGAGTLAELRWVTLPAALPAYLTGLRQGWAFAWRSLMAAELIAYSPQLGPGLGQLLDTGRELSDMPLVLASILLILFVGIAVESLIFAPAERRLVRSRGLAGAEMGYPLTLQLRDRRVLVVGGGRVAATRVCRLLADGAHVTVVAPEVGEVVAALVAEGRVTWLARGYQSTDLMQPQRAWLVHTATGDHTVDSEVADDCEGLGIWCVRADDGARSAAWSPAVANGSAGTPAEGLQIAVTGDRDPRRARAVRDAILAGLESGVLPVRRVRRVPGTMKPGRVYLVGGGPGDPGLLTVRGRALLAAADVVVADRLGPTDVLADLDPDVLVLDVGKRPGAHPVPQEEINALLVEHASAGRTVVRLKGGDPFVLGRGGEEALHCRAHGIPVEVVPGVTSAVSVPAAAGIPVTHRGITTSFVVSSAHDGGAVAAQAPLDATLVLLMGVSGIGETAARLMDAGRDPSTPVAFVERGWTPTQRTTVTTLEKAAWAVEHEQVKSPAVVVVGDVVRLRETLGDLR